MMKKVAVFLIALVVVLASQSALAKTRHTAKAKKTHNHHRPRVVLIELAPIKAKEAKKAGKQDRELRAAYNRQAKRSHLFGSSIPD